MADFTVTITVPDPKVAELVEALKAYYGKFKVVDGEQVAKTNADLKADFDADVRRRLKTLYVDYVTKQAVEPTLGETA